MKKTLESIPSIDQIDMEGQSVFMRLDLNVPIKDGVIQDDMRIHAAIPSLKYALGQRAKLIVASHLGRPRGPKDRKRLSLEPIAQRLNELLNVEVILVEEPGSDTPSVILRAWKRGQIILLENLRFDPGEMSNSDAFTRSLSENVDIYINDAFGVSHRAHSSVVGIPSKVKKSGLGFLVKKEIEVLDHLLHGAESPFALILGGAKVTDKIGVMNNLIDRVDLFVVGGAMAYTFLKAQNIPVGDSLVAKEKINVVRNFLSRLQVRGKKCLLPLDHVVTQSSMGGEAVEGSVKVVDFIEEGWRALDIGPKTVELFQESLGSMKTIFWNGPMGMFERPEFASGTMSLAEFLATRKEVFTVVGGGDSLAALKVSGYDKEMNHISTGGGASLEYLQGLSLPGIEALKKANRVH